MKRTKFTVELRRNKLASMICDFVSAACIEDGGMSRSERESYQGKLRKILSEIDESIKESEG